MNLRILFLVTATLFSYQPNASEQSGILYQSEAFTLYKDKVIQGDNQAVVVSPTHIRSTYKSPASQTYSRLISFKISINEKDNELPAGQNHWLLIGNEHESPVIRFGETPPPLPESPGTFLPVNYAYTFRVDMTPVIRQFEQKGYYETFDGNRIAKEDFKGFFLAGGSEPLTWDFANLANHHLQLKDTGKDNIYTLTVQLNPYKREPNEAKEWKLTRDVSHKPQYTSDQPIVDALYNLSLEEALKNIEPDSTFRTGAKWGGVWTRDVSYSIFLAFAYHEPEVAKISLLKKINRNRIVQDTGSGGAWPVSSDRTIWALAAWELYLCTGDQAWLQQAYTILKNTLDDDAKTLAQTQSGLYRGESSFLDWREQTYPKWMSNVDIYVSENLSTNVIHYQAYQILAAMAKELKKPHQPYQQQATALKKAIRTHLWMPDKGYFAQYLYGRPYLTVSPRFEALGEALSILFDVADDTQARSILEKSPVTAFGTTCIYPQIPGIPPYHNNAIWPFVQAYWNLAAAKTGHEKALTHGLAAIYRAGGFFLTNYENFVATTGDFMGTKINSDRMLWSMAGNLAMVHRVFIGMSFQPEGICFSPTIPKAYGGTRTLSHFRYRNADLTITVNGFGRKIKSFTLDGKTLKKPFIPATLTGTHTLIIEMTNESFDKAGIHLTENHVSLPAPRLSQEGSVLKWAAIKDAVQYRLYTNGKVTQTTTQTQVMIFPEKTNVYQVSAIDNAGWESFTSEPLLVASEKAIQIAELENTVPSSRLPYTHFSGKGFIEISTSQNQVLPFTLTVPEAGTYALDIRYSNGSGPWNTHNKCAIRSLYVNEAYAGCLVFPQRGTNKWSDWGWSNIHLLPLKAGTNTFSIRFEPWNTNMNVEINTAMLDYVRLVRMDE